MSIRSLFDGLFFYLKKILGIGVFTIFILINRPNTIQQVFEKADIKDAEILHSEKISNTYSLVYYKDKSRNELHTKLVHKNNFGLKLVNDQAQNSHGLNVDNGFDFDFMKFPNEDGYIVFGYTSNPEIKEGLLDISAAENIENDETTTVPSNVYQLDVFRVVQLIEINDSIKVWHVFVGTDTDKIYVKGVNEKDEIIKEILKEI